MKTKNSKNNSFSMGLCNPVIRKMSNNYSEVSVSQEATYVGITAKTCYFLLMSIVGVCIYFFLHSMFLESTPVNEIIRAVDTESGIYAIETTLPELGIACVAGIIAIFAPLLAWLIRRTIPVVGTLYALCEGFFIGMITGMLAPEYQWVSLVALVLTVSIVAVMLVLYTKRIVSVTQKFRTVLSTLMLSMIVGGVLIFIMCLIPFTREMAMGITSFMGSPVMGTVISVIYLVIAILFLLVDFNTIEECVEGRMDKSMEWMAAFGLAYTIIYIYFKILSLILRILGSSKK